MNDWLQALALSASEGKPCVLVTVASSKGSVPREPGAKMTVSATDVHGSIGGGQLEHQAIEIARAMLGGSATELRRFPLGPSLGQCCGGVVELLFDAIAAPDLHVVLFGAGHVGRALVKVLGMLPCTITWVDERETEFPRDIPANVSCEAINAPESEVTRAPAGSCFLVMTHSHALDFELSRAILTRGDFRYFGLIGSLTKRRRFEQRLRAQGVGGGAISRMTCPIGVAGIGGKEPATIAVAVAAQLLALREFGAVQERVAAAGAPGG